MKSQFKKYIFRGVVAMISCVRRVVNLNLIKFGTTYSTYRLGVGKFKYQLGAAWLSG
jgi:hypothetical protein